MLIPNREPHRKPRPPGAWPQTACPHPHPLGWARPQPQAQTGDTVEEALLPGSHLIPPVTARGRSATPPSGTQDTARSRGGRLSPALAIAPVGIGPLPSVSLQLPQPQTPPGPAGPLRVGMQGPWFRREAPRGGLPGEPEPKPFLESVPTLKNTGSDDPVRRSQTQHD